MGLEEFIISPVLSVFIFVAEGETSAGMLVFLQLEKVVNSNIKINAKESSFIVLLLFFKMFAPHIIM